MLWYLLCPLLFGAASGAVFRAAWDPETAAAAARASALTARSLHPTVPSQRTVFLGSFYARTSLRSCNATQADSWLADDQRRAELLLDCLLFLHGGTAVCTGCVLTGQPPDTRSLSVVLGTGGVYFSGFKSGPAGHRAFYRSVAIARTGAELCVDPGPGAWHSAALGFVAGIAGRVVHCTSYQGCLFVRGLLRSAYRPGLRALKPRKDPYHPAHCKLYKFAGLFYL